MIQQKIARIDVISGLTYVSLNRELVEYMDYWQKEGWVYESHAFTSADKELYVAVSMSKAGEEDP